MPDFISNLHRLISDVSTWLMFLVVGSVAVMFAWHAWMRTLAEEPGDFASRTRAMKNVLVGGGLALSALAISRLVLGYFMA